MIMLVMCTQVAYLSTLRIRMISSTISVYSFKGIKLVFSYNIVGLWRIGQ